MVGATLTSVGMLARPRHFIQPLTSHATANKRIAFPKRPSGPTDYGAFLKRLDRAPRSIRRLAGYPHYAMPMDKAVEKRVRMERKRIVTESMLRSFGFGAMSLLPISTGLMLLHRDPKLMALVVIPAAVASLIGWKFLRSPYGRNFETIVIARAVAHAKDDLSVSRNLLNWSREVLSLAGEVGQPHSKNEKHLLPKNEDLLASLSDD